MLTLKLLLENLVKNQNVQTLITVQSGVIMMPNSFDFRIVCVIIAHDLDSDSPSWVVITNDGFPTVYTSWVRVPLMVREWLSQHNDKSYTVNGSVIIGKPL